MKLTLENFRCHDKKTWIIPEKGLCLIDGQRGQGKSTILNGILYGLFGSSAVRQVKTFEKKKATVILEIGPLTIHRISNPRRLVVQSSETGSEYEGTAGQAVIEKWLGLSFDEFKFACYIAQKSNGSILSLSPQDQLRCVEKIALKDEDHLKFVERVKKAIKAEEQQIRTSENAVEVAKRLVKEFVDECDKCCQKTCPIEIEDEGDYDSCVRKSLEEEKDTLNTELKELEAKYDDAIQKLEDIRKSNNDARQLRTKKQSAETTIKRIDEELSDTAILLLSTEILAEKEWEIADVEKQINNRRVFDNFQDKTKQLQLLKNEKEKEIKDNLKEVKADKKNCRSEKELNSEIQFSTTEKPEYTKQEAMKELTQYIIHIRKEMGVSVSIKSSKAIVEWLDEKHDKIENEIKNLREDLEKVNQALGQSMITSKTYSCPECGTHVTFEEDKLVKSPDKESESAEQQLRKNIDDLRESITKREELQGKCAKASDKIQLLLECISTKKTYISQDKMIELENELKKLSILISKEEQFTESQKNLENNVSIVRLHEEIVKLKQELSSFSPTSDNLLDLEKKKMDIIKQVTLHYQETSRIESLKLELKDKKNELAAIVRQLRGQSSATSIYTAEKNIETMRKKISRLQKSLSVLTEDITACEHYEIFLRVNQKMIKSQTQHARASRKLQASNKKYQHLLRLKELSYNAEMVTVQQIIDDINEQSRYYLSLMFLESIDVRLQSIKETKKDAKLQMNVIVDYKSHKYDSIDQLSGGERDQANLAFVLGLNTMLGGKILMLDECLASLDADTNSDTLQMLSSEIGNERLVLVVSHEAVRGNFEHQIQA